MKVVIFNWRDLQHPKAGGAELATHQLASGLAKRGHNVVWFTSRHPNSAREEERANYTVVRRGNELSCRFFAARWLYARRDSFDIAIDEVNTLPYFTRLIMGKRLVVWMHQLAREVWLAEAPPGVGLLGYCLEPLLMSIYKDVPVITISESSAESFRKFGLRGPFFVSEIALEPPEQRPSQPQFARIGYVGRLARSKRVDHIIEALVLVREQVPQAHLVIVGSGSPGEGRRLRELVKKLRLDDAVTFCGRVSRDERDETMRSFDVLALASMREGWGLVVSEAARFGVPSVVYPVPGLVDSVQNGITGIVVDEQDVRQLAAGLVTVISSRKVRDDMSRRAMQYLVKYDDRRFLDRYEGVLEAVVTS